MSNGETRQMIPRASAKTVDSFTAGGIVLQGGMITDEFLRRF